MTEDHKIEDPVLALKREWETRWERYASETDDSDEVTNALNDRVNEPCRDCRRLFCLSHATIASSLIWA